MRPTSEKQRKFAAVTPVLRRDVLPPITADHLLAPAAPANLAEGTAAAAPVARIRGGLPPRALRHVHEYIDAHLDQKISLDELAYTIGLSMFHFARAFKQSEGMTPHNYLIQRRVERVMELLAGTDLPLSEIAMAVGFSDQSHCARRFREHVGVSPSDYRWSMR